MPEPGTPAPGLRPSPPSKRNPMCSACLDIPALLHQLDAGMAYRLTLLVAPAGYGKSALLRRWVATRDWPVAWVALQAGDDDLARFLRHLVTASQAIEPGIAGTILPILGVGDAGPLHDGLAAWLNALAVLDRDFALVLDGYERIGSASVHGAVAQMLDYPPLAMHLYIASRGEPPLQLPRLRVRRQLLQVHLPGKLAEGTG
jgi:LuxR family maltose regulon positive regulatory protein